MKLIISLLLTVVLLVFHLNAHAQGKAAKTSKSTALNRPSYILASDWKDAEAMREAGRSFSEAEDFNKSLICFRRAAQLNPMNAFYLGYAYANGKGVAINIEKAIHWYTIAAEAGEVTSLNNLGWIYTNKKNDDALAFMYYKKAAEKGSETAMNNLGAYYENGWGVQASNTEALRWYKKAVQAYNGRTELSADQTISYNQVKAAVARLENR